MRYDIDDDVGAQRVVVIGGGAAGAAVVGEMLAQADQRVRLTWVAGEQCPGRGVAYATSNPEHVLNVRAANMGLLADDTGEFVRFAKNSGGRVEPIDFLPRSLFGDYVQSTLERLMSDGLRRCAITILPADAVALSSRLNGSYEVQISNGQSLTADSVVLAVGALPSVPLPVVDDGATQADRYVVDPWKLPQLEKAPRRVIVVGSRLTAIDSILTVAGNWPEARIVALSRHGWLPGTHSKNVLEPYAFQTQLIDDFQKHPSIRHWLHIFRAAIAEDGCDWRSAIDGLRPITAQLWRSLDLVQRGRFLRHVRWLWDSARHRMPPQTAAAIDKLRGSGRLEVIAGRLRSVSGAAPVVTYRRRRDGALLALEADLVVQATGFESTTEPTPSRLLTHMIQSGLMRADPFGLGLEAGADGRLARADGSPTHGLRAIGTLLRGAVWESSSMPEIRALAKKIARDLLQELSTQAERIRSVGSWNPVTTMVLGKGAAAE
jgi:uncharacterized NAD(P)/FAD-binding protein YdhS